MKRSQLIPSMDVGMGIPLYATFHITTNDYGTMACKVGSKYLCLISSNIREKTMLDVHVVASNVGAQG